jgi:hypothetical protein
MFFLGLRNHFSRESTLGKISQIGRDIGIIASRKIPRTSLRETRREVVKRTRILLEMQGRENEIFITRKVTMMEVHHIQERRMI